MKRLLLTCMLCSCKPAYADEICVNWQTNDPGAVSTILQYTRTKYTANETCVKNVTSTPKKGARYCYTFTTPGDYAFRLSSVRSDGLQTEWSNEMTAVVE